VAWNHNVGPIGNGNPIQAGECLSSIAVRKGVTWKEIWNHADNTDIKDIRMHPNILLPGDKVTVPDKQKKNESRPDANRHRMRRKSVPCILRLRFTRFGQPRKGDAYRLEVDGYVRQGGKLNNEGAFEAGVWPAASEAVVLLGKDQDNLVDEFRFKLGWIAPANEVRGIQTRLWNLGYYHGPLNGTFDEATERAFLRFIQKNTAETHALTLNQFKQVWDSMNNDDQIEVIGCLVKAHGC